MHKEIEQELELCKNRESRTLLLSRHTTQWENMKGGWRKSSKSKGKVHPRTDHKESEEQYSVFNFSGRWCGWSNPRPADLRQGKRCGTHCAGGRVVSIWYETALLHLSLTLKSADCFINGKYELKICGVQHWEQKMWVFWSWKQLGI